MKTSLHKSLTFKEKTLLCLTAYNTIEIYLTFERILQKSMSFCLSTTMRFRKKNEYFTSSDAGKRGARGPLHWPLQYLADKLTLFPLGRADCPHLLLLAHPMFFPFRHHRLVLCFRQSGRF